MYDLYIGTLEYPGFVTSARKLTFHPKLEHTNWLTGVFLIRHAPTVLVTTPRPYAGFNWGELRKISAPVTVLTQWLNTATNCRTSTTSATSSGEQIKYKMTAALSTFLYLQYVTKQHAVSLNFREMKVI